MAAHRQIRKHVGKAGSAAEHEHYPVSAPCQESMGVMLALPEGLHTPRISQQPRSRLSLIIARC